MNKKILSIYLVILVLTSCTKDQILNNELPINGQGDNKSVIVQFTYPSIQDGRLYFDDFEDFEKFMNSFSKSDPEAINDMHLAHNFICWDDLLQAEDENELASMSNNYTETNIQDPWLCKVLNLNQEIGIGEVVCRVEDDYCYIYMKGYFDEIAKFESSGHEIELNTGEVVSDKLAAFKPLKDEKVWAFGFGWQTSPNYDYFNNDYRMFSQHWATNVFFYKSAGMKTVMEKRKKKNKWKNTNASKIVCSGSVTIEANYNGSLQTSAQTYTFNVVKANDDKAVHKIFEAGGIGVNITGGNLTSVTGASGDIKIIKSTFSNHSVTYNGITKSRTSKFWQWN